MTPAGWFHCPRCMCRREFCEVDPAGHVPRPGVVGSEPLPDLECSVCEYTYTTVTVDQRTGPPRRVHQIPAEARTRARGELRAEYLARVRANGGRLPPGV